MKKFYRTIIILSLVFSLSACFKIADTNDPAVAFTQNMMKEFSDSLEENPDITALELIEKISMSEHIKFEHGFAEYNEDNRFGIKTEEGAYPESYNVKYYDEAAYLYSKSDDVSVIIYAFKVKRGFRNGLFENHIFTMVDLAWYPKCEMSKAAAKSMGKMSFFVFCSENVE